MNRVGSRGVTHAAVFGSVARGEATERSDVDLLVEFEPGAQLSYLDLERIADDLKPIFGGAWRNGGRMVASIHSLWVPTTCRTDY